MSLSNVKQLALPQRLPINSMKGETAVYIYFLYPLERVLEIEHFQDEQEQVI